MAGYLKQLTDLDNIFRIRQSGDPIRSSDTGCQILGVDIRNRYYPKQSGTTAVAATGYILANGSDLNQIFDPPYTPPPPQIIEIDSDTISRQMGGAATFYFEAGVLDLFISSQSRIEISTNVTQSSNNMTLTLAIYAGSLGVLTPGTTGTNYGGFNWLVGRTANTWHTMSSRSGTFGAAVMHWTLKGRHNGPDFTEYALEMSHGISTIKNVALTVSVHGSSASFDPNEDAVIIQG